MSTPPPDIPVATGIPKVERFRAAEWQAIAALHKYDQAERDLAWERKRLARRPGDLVAQSRVRRMEEQLRMLERHLDHAEKVAADLEAIAREVAPGPTKRVRRSWAIRMAHRARDAGRQWD